MRETHRIARENLKGTLLRRKRDYEVKQEKKQEAYEVGDFVYKLNNAIKKGSVRNYNLFTMDLSLSHRSCHQY